MTYIKSVRKGIDESICVGLSERVEHANEMNSVGVVFGCSVQCE